MRRVQLIKNGKVVGAYVPFDGTINFIEEHDEVTIQGMGGSQRGQMGSIPGLKYRVIAVNGTDIYQIVRARRRSRRDDFYGRGYRSRKEEVPMVPEDEARTGG